jgi:hypothetical protein
MPRLGRQLKLCSGSAWQPRTAAIGPWQKPRSPPGTAAYWGTAATKGTSAVVRSPDGVHAPRHGRRQRPTKLEEQVKRSSLTGTQWHYGLRCGRLDRFVPIREPPASRNSPPSAWSKAASSEATRSRPSGDPISPPACSRPQPSPKSYEATGPSKEPSLEPRRYLQRGSITPACRPRRQEYGRRTPLRSQSGSPSRRQTIHQATPQARLLGPKISA